MRLSSHKATIGGTITEWRVVADRVTHRGTRGVIERGSHNYQTRGRYWDYMTNTHVEPVIEPGDEILLRFYGGSIKRVVDAIVVLEAEVNGG